jgi:hypothetical protein
MQLTHKSPRVQQRHIGSHSRGQRRRNVPQFHRPEMRHGKRGKPPVDFRPGLGIRHGAVCQTKSNRLDVIRHRYR